MMDFFLQIYLMLNNNMIVGALQNSSSGEAQKPGMKRCAVLLLEAVGTSSRLAPPRGEIIR